jgi:steroid 5-alpha reductase family enzyme
MNGQVYLQAAVVIFIFMCYVFFLAQLFKNNSIVDIFWGLGFVVLVTFFSFNSHSYIENIVTFTTKDVINLFTVIWGFRLAIHIYIKNKGQAEDWRYVNFRKLWTKKNIPHWLGAFLQVFMLQGFFMFIVAMPIIHANQYFTPVSNLTYFGVFIWLIGFYFEAVGDYQKSQFKKNPANKEKILTTGLWKYTRHPNYFGETLMWWAIFIISINFFQPVNSLINLISPITLTWLLTKVSGVPMLESKYKGNEEYQQYIKNTPSFFPKFW